MISRIIKYVVLIAFVIASVAVTYRFRAPESPPNIVLISIDTLRRDYLGVYGFGDLDISPKIDALASMGTRFENAVTVSGTTVPSHGSMLTGLYPRQHGARSNWFRLNPEVVTIAQKLGNVGYRTGAFVSLESIVTTGGLGRGFEYDNTPFDKRTGKITQTGELTLQQSQKWLRDLQGDDPFYLWLHLFEPHGPYEMTEYSKQRMSDYQGVLKDGVIMEILKENRGQIMDSMEDMRALSHLYSGKVNLADQLVGELISTLETLGTLENTVVIFTSDHGQGLGENQQLGHGAILWESVIRVPLIVTDFRSPKAHVVTERVGVIDIAPTIGDFAGLTERFDLNGQSLKNAWQKTLDPERAYFSEVELRVGESADLPWYDPDMMAVYSGDFKLSVQKDQTQLFEIPAAENKLIPVPQNQSSALAEYLAGLSDDFLKTQGQVLSQEVSEFERNQLQGLGYTQ